MEIEQKKNDARWLNKASEVIAVNAVQAAPVGLTAAVSAAAVVSGTAVSTSTAIAATKTIAMTTLQKTLITVTVAVLAGAGIYEARQATQLREQNQTLQQSQAPLLEQIAQLKSDNQSLSNHVAQTSQPSSLSSDRLRELLRLRGQVGVLKRQQRELEQLAATAQSQPPASAQPAPVITSQASTPSPFQLQLISDEPADDTELLTNNAGGAGGETLRVQKAPLLDYTAISSATVSTNLSSGAPQIDIELSDVGKELFAAITRENINKRLAMVLDGKVFSAPAIRSEITDGKAQISGSYTGEELRQLAAKINDAIRNQQ